MILFRYFYFLFIPALLTLFSGCEDLIEMDLDAAEPQYVIVGEIRNDDIIHQVTIHKTVSITSSAFDNPVSGAAITLYDSRDNQHLYKEVAPGIYEVSGFEGVPGVSYELHVQVEGRDFRATSHMPEYVPIDSIGTVSNSFFNEEIRFVAVKFQDPIHLRNFYRYQISINNAPYIFLAVFDDKFNNGRAVSHELFHPDYQLEIGDEVLLQRQSIDQANYTYWSAIGFSNPAASVPANPVSNFDNGALGYFSAYSKQEYGLEVVQP